MESGNAGLAILPNDGALVAAVLPCFASRITVDPGDRTMDSAGTTADDGHLWQALAAGRPEAFARLMDEHGARLLGQALAVSGNRTVAEDAVQDVLLTLVQRPALLTGVAQPLAYLARMVRNRTIDILRREPGPMAVDANAVWVVPPDPGGAETAISINAALAQLPAEQREVVVLKAIHGLTFAAIAEATGVPANTVASRYRYALEKLTTVLKDLSHEP